MNEAGRGKKAIFDQDSNPWVPWDPTKKKELAIYKQNSNQKVLFAAASLEPSKMQ